MFPPRKLAGLCLVTSIGTALLSAALVGRAWLAHAVEIVEGRLEEDLRARAILAEGPLREALESGGAHALDALCKEIGRETATRLTWIDPSGRVLGDSETDPAGMENHARRPEIREALAGREGFSVRMSPTLGVEFLYHARAVRRSDRTGGGLLGVLRTAVTRRPVLDAAAAARRRLLPGILAAAALSLAGAWIALLPVRRFALRVRQAAVRFGRGDLAHRVPVSRLRDAGEAASALNRMAARLQARLDALEREGRGRETLLASMVEGVIAVDPEERILEMNRAAGALLGIDPEAARGRALQEEVRNPDLQGFVDEAIASEDLIEGRITVREPRERTLQAHGTRLRVPDRERPGALVVLHDLTRVERLEGLRREFVANVSHELRTPITSICGFVETLLDGPVESPAELRRFLGIILKEARRLQAMLEDLLVLARVEQSGLGERIALERRALRPILEGAASRARERAEGKGIPIEVRCDADLEADLHPTLLERALENLLDNAVHYSKGGGGGGEEHPVTLEAERRPHEVLIRVRDRGLGIPPEHLGRVFERFYRIPAYRDRKPDGTGLGLAIVKHVVQAHGGRVEIESEPGKGTVVSIRLPPPG